MYDLPCHHICYKFITLGTPEQRFFPFHEDLVVVVLIQLKFCLLVTVQMTKIGPRPISIDPTDCCHDPPFSNLLKCKNVCS